MHLKILTMDQTESVWRVFHINIQLFHILLCGKLKEALKLGLLVYQCSSAHETYGEVFFLYKDLPYAFSHIEFNPK